MFPDDESCRAYLEDLRWATGFVCPACEVSAVPWRQTRGRLVCAACRHQSSVTAGTIFDKTRTALTTWFEAAWHVTTAKNGMAAKTLEPGRLHAKSFAEQYFFEVVFIPCGIEAFVLDSDFGGGLMF